MQDNAQSDAPDMTINRSWVDRYMPSPSPAQGYYGANLIDLATIRGFVWRQRFILAGVLVTAILLGFVATLLVKPIYESTATVRVDPEGANIVEGQDLEASYIASSEISRYLQTLGEVVKSRTMAYLVVDSLKLASREDFLGEAATSEPPQGMTAKGWQAKRREIAASIVQGGVSVDVPDSSRVISVKYRSPDPAMAAVVANSLADNFLTDGVRRSLEANAYAQKYLEQQIAKTRTSLQDAERAAIAYAKANRIVTQTMTSSSDQAEGGADTTTGTITGATLSSINESYTQARTARIEAEQRWRTAAQLPAAQLPEVLQSSTVQSLSTEHAKLAAKLSDLRQRYDDTYPEVAELKAQITALDREIAKASGDIKSSLRSAYQVALKQEAALSTELRGASDQTLDEQDRRVQFGLLEREAQAMRQQLASLLDRYNQITSAANVKSGNITLLDAAVASGSPVSPDLTKNMLIAVVLGLGLAIGLAVLRDVLDDRLRSAEEVERKLGLKLLGLTPLVAEDQSLDESPPLDEAYSSIRTAIEFALPRREHNLLVFTSSMPSEGKSLSAVVLARKYAQLGRKVLLIDGDLRKPSVSAYFGAKRREQGFVEVVVGACSLESALIEQPQDNLDVLPVGTIPANPVDALSSPLLNDFLTRVSAEYSMIIVDSPPIMGLADAPLLSRFADGVVFIVESNRAHFGQTRSALRRLRDGHANVLGVVLTKFRSLEAGQSYNYHYNYYQYGSEKA